MPQPRLDAVLSENIGRIPPTPGQRIWVHIDQDLSFRLEKTDLSMDCPTFREVSSNSAARVLRMLGIECQMEFGMFAGPEDGRNLLLTLILDQFGGSNTAFVRMVAWMDERDIEYEIIQWVQSDA